MSPIEVTMGDHLLRVLPINSLLDVEFDAYRNNEQRLVLVMSADMRSDAPGLTTYFETALGRRGVLTGVRTEPLPALAADLGMPVGIAAEWLAQHDVTVACLGVPADVVVVAVLGASGISVGQALGFVRAQMPDGLGSPGEEVLASVAVEHALGWHDLSRRRAEARARGESPWEVR